MHQPPIDSTFESNSEPESDVQPQKTLSSTRKKKQPSEKAIAKSQYEVRSGPLNFSAFKFLIISQRPEFPTQELSNDEAVNAPLTSSGPSDTDGQASDNSGDDVEINVDKRNKGWPVVTHLIYSKRTRIKEQKDSVRDVLHAAIRNVFESMFWDNPFPTGNDKKVCVRDALFKGAVDVKERSIANRLKSDKPYVKAMSSVVHAPNLTFLLNHS